MFEKIVVGYAGEQAGRDAVKLAARLAATLSSHVTVVFPYHPLLASVPGDQAEERVREEVMALQRRRELKATSSNGCSGLPWKASAIASLAGYTPLAGDGAAATSQEQT
jgi:nucleotide-binding universal stress UspA family protein